MKLSQLLSILIATLFVFSFSATRVFYDGFESGNTNLWQIDGGRNRGQVVTAAVDGAKGPRTGTYMLRCNYDGTVAWNDPRCFESVYTPTDNYTNELFIRTRLRLDQDFDKTPGSAAKLLRIYVNLYANNPPIYHDIFLGASTSSGLNNCLCASGISGGCNSYWGGAPGDNSNSTSNWHTVEYYINQTTGVVKIWNDGILVRNTTGVNSEGVKWSPFNITSNFSDPHDATNYVYFDDVEVFSDASTGTAATGLMSDATVSVGGTEIKMAGMMEHWNNGNRNVNVYDVLGKRISQMPNTEFVMRNETQMQKSGIYFTIANENGKQVVKKMMVVR